MKLKFILMASLLIFGLNTEAQDIQPHDRTMSMGSHPGFYIDLEDAERKNVEKLWKNYLKEYSKKVKKNKKEFYTEEGRIPIVNGSAELTLHSQLEEGRNLTTLYTWVDLGGGVFMNEEDHPTQVEGFIKFMEDFYFVVKKDVIKRELEEEEKALEKLDKELKKLMDKNEDFHKEILKAQEKIRKAEEEIEQNLNEQNDKQVQIEKQKKLIEKIIDKFNSVGKNS
jgi:molecular chaperone DnaK (HSP70)